MDYPFENRQQMWAAVRFTLDSDGWTGYIAPSLEQIIEADLNALSSVKRGEVPDDFLRGRISMAKTLLTVLPAKVTEFMSQDEQGSVLGPDGQPIAQGDPYGVSESGTVNP